jgi:nitrogen fixation protein FixH
MTLRGHWGAGIAAVYTAFAAGTVAFVVFATKQPVDLVSPDYYAQSIAHDGHLDAAARAAALDDAFSFSVSGDGRRIDLNWRSARPSAGAVTLYRPAGAAADRRVPIAPDATGRQTVAMTDALSGLWIVQVAWTAGGQEYYAERRVVIR